MVRRIGRLVLPVFIALAMPALAIATPGDLDPSFGDGGKVVTDFGGVDVATAVVIQPDGKLVVAGRTDAGGNATFALARYNSNGSLDSTFGSAGLVITDFGGNDQAFAVALQPDGKIVTAGRRGSDVIVARYHPDGTVDLSFATAGRAVTNFGATELALALALQPDGKIMIAGRTTSGGTFNFALARYQSSGALDTTFGQQGLVSTDFGGSVDRVFALVLQPDGKAVVAGDSDANFALARYNPDGSLDTTFGSGGKVVTTFGGRDQASAVVLQPDGKIVVAGQTDVNTSVDFALARYNPDGSLDGTFGTGGRVTTDFTGSGNDIASAVALQFDGKMLVGGGSQGNFAVARYLANGSLDPSFGNAGMMTTDLGGDDLIHALVLQPDGAIVAVGEANDQFALARYQAFLPLSLELTPNRTAFQSGDTLQFEVSAANPGPPSVVDVYFGVVPPPSAAASFGCSGGDPVVFLGPGFVPAPTCLSSVSSGATSLAPGVTLAGGFGPVLLSNFFSVVWPGNSPPGNYNFFLALTRAGTLEPIRVVTAPVSFTP